MNWFKSETGNTSTSNTVYKNDSTALFDEVITEKSKQDKIQEYIEETAFKFFGTNKSEFQEFKLWKNMTMTERLIDGINLRVPTYQPFLMGISKVYEALNVLNKTKSSLAKPLDIDRAKKAIAYKLEEFGNSTMTTSKLANLFRDIYMLYFETSQTKEVVPLFLNEYINILGVEDTLKTDIIQKGYKEIKDTNACVSKLSKNQKRRQKRKAAKENDLLEYELNI